MLLKFLEQTIDNFRIPSFTLTKGQIVIIQLPNGPFFYPPSSAMIDILTGKAINDKVEISSPFKYAEHFKENEIRRKFFPMTVAKYHDKYANKVNPIYKQIYEIPWITPKMKAQSLAGTPRRQLCVYTTLSWTNNIIFDLVGVDLKGGQDIYKFVSTMVNFGGAAILLDNNDEFKHDCTTFMQATSLGECL